MLRRRVAAAGVVVPVVGVGAAGRVPVAAAQAVARRAVPRDAAAMAAVRRVVAVIARAVAMAVAAPRKATARGAISSRT